MATTPGCNEADTYAGNSIDPWGDDTFTTSPRLMPSFAAASAGTSTQASHTDWVMVSGVS